MISRYKIFCTVIECASFTKAAAVLGYSQSAVSQTVKSLEYELGTVLVNRKKDGIFLTPDGMEYYGYISSIVAAEDALGKKHREIIGLESTSIRIGTFTSVSRNILPKLIKDFKTKYSGANFMLRQSEYTSIEQWIQSGSVDFGFVSKGAISSLSLRELYTDEMVAVLPKNHRLSERAEVTLSELADEPLILLDEGEHSVSMDAFAQNGLSPSIEYTVYDDYTILAMIRQGLGISIMYRLVLKGFEQEVCIVPIKETPKRTIALACREYNAMPFAARKFYDFVVQNTPQIT